MTTPSPPRMATSRFWPIHHGNVCGVEAELSWAFTYFDWPVLAMSRISRQCGDKTGACFVWTHIEDR